MAKKNATTTCNKWVATGRSLGDGPVSLRCQMPRGHKGLCVCPVVPGSEVEAQVIDLEGSGVQDDRELDAIFAGEQERLDRQDQARADEHSLRQMDAAVSEAVKVPAPAATSINTERTVAQVACETCKGEGRVRSSGTSIKCPDCGGSGRVTRAVLNKEAVNRAEVALGRPAPFPQAAPPTATKDGRSMRLASWETSGDQGAGLLHVTDETTSTYELRRHALGSYSMSRISVRLSGLTVGRPFDVAVTPDRTSCTCRNYVGDGRCEHTSAVATLLRQGKI